MSADVFRFVAIAAAFVQSKLVPPLTAFLASEARNGAAAGAGYEALCASLAAWIADIEAGRADEALSPERFADVIEAIWMLSIVGVRTPFGQSDPDYVDILFTPAGVRATHLALAAARALDVLRSTDVAGEVAGRQHAMVERIASSVGSQVPAHSVH